MEAYLEKLLSQIRCKKARPYISDEIRGHIECQIEDNLAAGMDYEEAQKCAVEDMGDPVEVGVSLDKIHRPRFAWQLIAVAGVLSLLGIITQLSVFNKAVQSDLELYLQESYRSTLISFVSAVIMGFILMSVIYFIDYTVLAKYSKIICLGILALALLRHTGFFGGVVNGSYHSIGFGMFRISLTSLMMFYVPFYGAILYKYKGGGVFALIKACIWLILPVIVTFRLPNIVVTGIIMVSMVIQLSTAIIKGWFRVSVKKALAWVWGAFTVLPAVLLFVMYKCRLLAAYQIARIDAILDASGDASYFTTMLRNLRTNIQAVGDSGNDVISSLPNFNSDYIFTYILNSYGFIAGIAICAVLAVLVMFVFGAANKQKNELGMVMGFGCGMILLMNVVINVLSAVGVLPPASTFLPFLSVGRSNILLCYGLMGLVMSIYRYKDVYPKNVKASQVAIEKKVKFTIKI